MKKIFTLTFGLLLAVALMAADRRPSVMLQAAGNFEVVIDGRSYVTRGNTIQLNRLHQGRHTIKVYELRRNYFGMQKRLVSQSKFRTSGFDMLIRVDRFGQIRIKERTRYMGYGSANNRDFRTDRDNRFERDRSIDRFKDYDRDEMKPQDWDDNDERDWRDNFNK